VTGKMCAQKHHLCCHTHLDTSVSQVETKFFFLHVFFVLKHKDSIPRARLANSTERKKGRSRSGRERPNGRRTDFRCCFWLTTCSKEVATSWNNETRYSKTTTLASFLPCCLRDFLKKSVSLYHRLIEIVILHTKF
jgi:hypothetical protein